MSVTNGYITVDQLRAELGDDDSRLPDARLERAINAASRAVDQWTSRRFWQDADTVTRRYRPDCPRGIARVDDISTKTGLVVTVDNQTWTLDDDFELGPLNADADGGAYAWWELLPLARCFPHRTVLTVTARWGWSQIPAQVEEATLLRAVALFKRKEAAFGIAEFGEFGPVRITRRDPDVMALLAPFERPMVA